MNRKAYVYKRRMQRNRKLNTLCIGYLMAAVTCALIAFPPFYNIKFSKISIFFMLCSFINALIAAFYVKKMWNNSMKLHNMDYVRADE